LAMPPRLRRDFRSVRLRMSTSSFTSKCRLSPSLMWNRSRTGGDRDLTFLLLLTFSYLHISITCI
jgi:hypothetical protein